MRKPRKLTGASGVFQANFDDGRTLNKNISLQDSKTSIDTGFDGGQYIQPPQPDWLQEDPEALDYIKNKEVAEQYRPVTVNGEEFLNEDRNSGALNIVGDDGLLVSTDGNSLHLSIEGYSELKEDVKNIYHQEYTENENGEKVPSGEPTGVLAVEIARATKAEKQINDKIASLFRVEKDSNGENIHKGEIVDYIADAIPIATLTRLGRVRASKSVNQINVDEKTGVMEVNSLSTDKLVQGEQQLVLNGGNTILTIDS